MKSKKIIISLIATIFIITSTLSLYIFNPEYLQSFENKVSDTFFKIRGVQKADERVVILDIDEKSLKALGQWPWSRNKVAKILDNLTASGVGIIGLDIVFAEADRTSPKFLFKDFNISSKGLNLDDYDEVLSKSLASSPVIGGYFFNFAEVVNVDKEVSVPATFMQKGNSNNKHIFIKPKGILPNIEKLQNAMYSSGFFNVFPDFDGIVRKIPLLFEYNNIFYPSLSLEMIRVATNSNKVIINVDDVGVKNISLNNIQIPTTHDAQLFINYVGARNSYKYIPAIDAYNNNFDKKIIEGSFVLLGTSAVGLFDLRTTPFDNVYPGVEVHATVIDNIINSNFLYQPSWTITLNIFIAIVFSLAIFAISILFSPILSAFISLVFINGFVYFSYYMFTRENMIISILFPLLSMLLVWLFTMLINYIFESRQKEMIKNKFSRKVSKAVVEELIKDINSDALVGKKRNITIFFSDIRGFTNISEELGDASRIIEFLNQYMTPMSDIIMQSKGTIDKFIGDAIMAYWNAPNEVKNHEDVAVTASLQQLAILDDLNKKLDKMDFPKIDIGIGLNTGDAIVGEMGSDGRSDYTVIGDPVNLASRLEGLCKPYGAKLIISEYVKNGLKNKYVIRDLDLVQVKGKTEPVNIFEVMDFADKKEIYENELEKYNTALELYRNSKFIEAKLEFEKLYANYSSKLYIVYMQRCEHFIKTPPKNFDGVFTFTTK